MVAITNATTNAAPFWIDAGGNTIYGPAIPCNSNQITFTTTADPTALALWAEATEELREALKAAAAAGRPLLACLREFLDAMRDAERAESKTAVAELAEIAIGLTDGLPQR